MLSCWGRAADYLIRMSLPTEATPLTPCATATARSALAREVTKPLNCTRPLKVSTMISADFRVGSLKMAVLTRVVMDVSSRYWPVLSCFWVEAQPARAVRATAATRTEMRLNEFMRDAPVIRIAARRALAGLADNVNNPSVRWRPGHVCALPHRWAWGRVGQSRLLSVCVRSHRHRCYGRATCNRGPSPAHPAHPSGWSPHWS